MSDTAISRGMRPRRSLTGFRVATGAAAPDRGSGRRLDVAGALAQPVKVTLGALGPGAQLVTGLLERAGPVVERLAELVALPGCVAPQLAELGGVSGGLLVQAVRGSALPGCSIVQAAEDLSTLPLRTMSTWAGGRCAATC